MSTKTRTEHGQVTRTEGGQSTQAERGQKADRKPLRPLPRGIRIRWFNDGRAKPFLLLVGGNAREFFDCERDAHIAGLDLADKEREFGREVRDFDVAEWRRYMAAKRDKFGGMEPDWSALSARVTLETSALTVAQAVENYRTARAGDGLAPGTMAQMKKKLARFAAVFGQKKLHEVEASAVRAWLVALQADFEPWTVKDHLKVANTFWEHARVNKWCLDNPLEAVNAPKIVAEAINILSVEETAKLFAENAGEPVVGRLALEAFGGLRFSSAGRLVAADLKWADCGIELPGKLHKSGRRHYLDGLPDNLWAWLKHAPAACWEMTEQKYMQRKGEAFIRAKVTSTPNCLRHSFATYHVASKRDAAATAVLMQHTNPAMLYRHYKGNATAADGVKYFQIVP